MAVIYAWLNTDNFKTYVGQSLSPLGRKYGHLARYRNGYNHPLYDAMRKHGLQAFQYVILEEVSSEALDVAEQRWIALMCSTDRRYGYNLEAGGRGKGQISEETREKLKIARRKRQSFSAATRQLWSERRRARWSETTVQRILEMYDKGMSVRAIARELDLTRNRMKVARIVRHRCDC